MFKSDKYSLDTIYKEILKRVEHDKLFEYLKKCSELQVKFKGFRITKPNCYKDLIIKNIIELYPKEVTIESFIINRWKELAAKEKLHVSKLKDKEKIKNYMQSRDFSGDNLIAATLLFIQEDKDLNKLGDTYFEKYLKKDNKQYLTEVTNNMKKVINEKNLIEIDEADRDICNILNMSIGEYISLIESYKQKYDKVSEYHEKSKEEIQKLKEKLKEAISLNKEKDKSIKELSNKISNLETDIKNNIKSLEHLQNSTANNLTKQLTVITQKNENLLNKIALIEKTKISEQAIEKLVSKSLDVAVDKIIEGLKPSKISVEKENIVENQESNQHKPNNDSIDMSTLEVLEELKDIIL